MLVKVIIGSLTAEDIPILSVEPLQFCRVTKLPNCWNYVVGSTTMFINMQEPWELKKPSRNG